MAAGVAALRLAYCLDLPSNTGDAVRHLLYGVAVLEHGIGIADVPLAALSAALSSVPWADRPFNYPPVALYFDTAVAAISPRLGVWKLALTLLEAASAVLLARITGSRWLGLLYWASPVSIWWVSHEGQIEPIQNVLALAAIFAMGRRRWVGWALLALAIQAKGFALFLLPWFVLEEIRAVGRERAEGGSGIVQAWGFLLGLAPLASLLPLWSPANVLGSAGLTLNPWHWNALDQRLMGRNPGWMVAVGQAVTWGLLAAGCWVALVRGRLREAAGPTLFVAALKTVTNAQPWYLLTLPVLWAPLGREGDAVSTAERSEVGSAEEHHEGGGGRWSDRRILLALVVVVILMEPQSLVSIFTGDPVGFTMGAFYEGVDAWTVFRLPGR